jgi:hypothetical protein
VGVSKQAIGKACKPGGALFNTLYDGRRIDALHEDAIKYAHDRDQKKAVAKRMKPKKQPVNTVNTGTDDEYAIDDWETGRRDLGEVQDMSLRWIVMRYGTQNRFLLWVRALHELEKVRERRIKNDEREKLLVSRKLILKGIIDPIQTFIVRILTDGAKTMGMRAHSMAIGGKTVDEVCEYMQKTIGSYASRVKDDIASAVRKIEKDPDAF